jgi:hypothetical protein
MVKPIRIQQTEIDAKRNLPPEQFADYEDLEKRLDTLSPSERRYYELLQRLAYLQQMLLVKGSLDKLLE